MQMKESLIVTKELKRIQESLGTVHGLHIIQLGHESHDLTGLIVTRKLNRDKKAVLTQKMVGKRYHR